MGFLKILLIVGSLMFVLSWSTWLFGFKEKTGRILYVSGLSSQILFLTYLIYIDTAILNSPDSWLLFIINAVSFNVISLFSRESKHHWFPYFINLLLLILALWGLPSELIKPFHIIDKFYLVHLIFGGISFGLVSLWIFRLLAYEQSRFNTKLISSLALTFWALKIVSYGLWTEWMWGRFWTGLFFDYQLIVTLVLLLLSAVLTYKKTPINRSVLLIVSVFILFFMVVPLYLLEPQHSGYT